MTITGKPNLLTREGLKKLTKELELLTTTKREAVAERLHQAFQDGQDGDFIDNAELEAARNEQSFLEGRILKLEMILGNYQIIEDDGPSDVVGIGDHVTVSEVGFDDEENYQLVGAAEADPDAGNISNESPLGRALLGSKVGDIVKVNAPNGVIEFKIVKID